MVSSVQQLEELVQQNDVVVIGQTHYNNDPESHEGRRLFEAWLTAKPHFASQCAFISEPTTSSSPSIFYRRGDKFQYFDLCPETPRTKLQKCFNRVNQEQVKDYLRQYFTEDELNNFFRENKINVDIFNDCLSSQDLNNFLGKLFQDKKFSHLYRIRANRQLAMNTVHLIQRLQEKQPHIKKFIYCIGSQHIKRHPSIQDELIKNLGPKAKVKAVVAERIPSKSKIVQLPILKNIYLDEQSEGFNLLTYKTNGYIEAENVELWAGNSWTKRRCVVAFKKYWCKVESFYIEQRGNIRYLVIRYSNGSIDMFDEWGRKLDAGVFCLPPRMYGF